MDDRDKKLAIVGAAVVVGTLVIGVAVGISFQRPPPAVAASGALAPPVVRPPPSQTPPPAAPGPEARPLQASNDAEPETDADLARRVNALPPDGFARAICTLETRANTAVTGAALARNASRFEGELVAFNGTVYEVQDVPGGGTFLRVSMGSSEHIVAVIAPVQPPDDVLANARVRVWGRMAGTFSYTSQAGWNITIPKLIAYAVYPRRDAPNCA